MLKDRGLRGHFLSAGYPAARIYSIEADPENFSLLEKNTASEPRIRPIHACVVGARQATVTFSNEGPAWGRRRTAGSGTAVPGLTLDELLARFAISRIDLLKLDIEGGEREVLARGHYLDVVDHIVAELHYGYGFTEFQQDVEAHGLAARAADAKCGAITAHRLPRSG